MFIVKYNNWVKLITWNRLVRKFIRVNSSFEMNHFVLFIKTDCNQIPINEFESLNYKKILLSRCCWPPYRYATMNLHWHWSCNIHVQCFRRQSHTSSRLQYFCGTILIRSNFPSTSQFWKLQIWLDFLPSDCPKHSTCNLLDSNPTGEYHWRWLYQDVSYFLRICIYKLANQKLWTVSWTKVSTRPRCFDKNSQRMGAIRLYRQAWFTAHNIPFERIINCPQIKMERFWWRRFYSFEPSKSQNLLVWKWRPNIWK